MRKIQQTGSDHGLVQVPEVTPRDGQAAESGGSSGSGPLTALRNRPFLAILIFLAVAGAGVPVALRTAKPLYYSNTMIYVSPTFDGTLREDRTQRPQFDIQQKMLMIHRYDVVTRTIRKLEAAGIDIRQPQESEQMAAERLAKALEVTHIPDSYEISVGMHDKDPRNLAEILNSLTEVFIETSKSEELSGKDSRIETLKAERGRLDAELNADLEARSDIGRSLGVVSFEQLPADRLVDSTRSTLDQARRERMEAEAEVALLERDASLAISLAPPAPQVDMAITASRERLKQRRDEIEGQLARMRPKHPDYQTLSSELTRINDQLKEIPVAKQAEASRVETASSQLLSKARIELERARKAESELNLELTRDIARVDATTGEFQRGKDLSVRIEQIRNQIGAIDDRLSYFRVEESAPGFLRVSSPARTPLFPEKNNRNKYLASVLGLALAAGIGGVVLIDMARAKICRAGDVQRVLGFPPLGVLLAREPGTELFAHEQFVRMVNNLERVFRRSEARIFVFTPVSPGVSNAKLVNSIAAEFEARHIRAGVLAAGTWPGTGGEGVAETRIVSLPSEVALEEAAPADRRRKGILGLNHSRDHFPAEDAGRKSVGGLAGTIEHMLADHDLVLVEAAPLLLSADTEYLVSLGAVTFLTIAAGKVSMGDLKRAGALMERLRPAGIAAILRGVSLKSSDPHLRSSFREFEAFRKSGRDLRAS